ncbi:hypothetical protein LKO27_04825 [Tessaracoccus sp. OS52]|uniref:hypothetical protein n=1 Tax=Tessaracoccus sp. OS52 TaxID=2886691 RepID=UPI001D11F4C2|nr:hypothetical protein [Tessaracoccus sp. OS52]MCC2592740.1 hypothetical protein [Tessaracoccus sp. OS52]
MSQPSEPQPPADPLSGLADHYPLSPEDPVRIGDYWLDSRLTATRAGMAFSAHENDGDSVMVVLLAEGAAGDPAARARFSGEINAMHIDTVVARGGEGQDDGRTAVRFRDESDDPLVAEHEPLAPWVALAFDGTVRAVREAERVLHAVDLERTAPLGRPAGPDYKLHWAENTAHGTTRVWPLPWPGRADRAGWISVLVSWLLMMLIAAVAVLLAILVFQNQPPVSPPPPIPSEGSGSPQSAEPTSGQPTDSQSPSGSPTQSGNQPPPSDNPSMQQPSGDESGPGDPSPNKKL